MSKFQQQVGLVLVLFMIALFALIVFSLNHNDRLAASEKEVERLRGELYEYKPCTDHNRGLWIHCTRSS